MKVTYLKLENVAGIYVGTGRTSIEIDFSKSKNKIIAIQSENGRGKSVLISSISPFSSVTSVDERSSLSYIIPKKNGYKEIHYQDKDNTFIIKHYYKAKDNTHSIKSYFMMNGNELNENGNVRSFLSLVEIHMGFTQEMMRLIRLGTNVNSFITLTPAARKEYIGKLIEEIDMYMQIYRKINKDMLVTRSLLQVINQNLYNCHVTDPIVEGNKLTSLDSQIHALSEKRDKVIGKISKVQTLMNENNIDELRRRKQEAESAIDDFHRTEGEIQREQLSDVSVEDLIKRRTQISDEKSELQGKINAYRISIDNTLRAIERLEMNVKRIISNHDVQSLVEAIAGLRSTIENTSKIITSFQTLGSTSDEVNEFMSQLASYNKISQMIYSLGNKPTDVYLRLRREKRNVEKFLKEQSKKRMSCLNESDMRILFDKIFGDDTIISPNCNTEYMECPYYRLSETIMDIKGKIEEDTYDDETLRYIQVISRNIDTILNELDISRKIKIPDKIKDDLTEKRMLDRMEQRLPFFDLTSLQEYLTLLREWESYCQNLDKLKMFESQLSMYKKSGVDNQLGEIEEYKKSIDFYKENIHTLEGRIQVLSLQLSTIDHSIGLVTRYQNSKKTYDIFHTTLDNTNKVLIPLETAASEKRELEYQLRELDQQIRSLKQSHQELESKLNEYNRLVDEGKKLEKTYSNLALIQESVSTKKGIPVIYMKSYLGKIQKLTNELLQLIYDDELQLSNFKVTQETFEVPYIKNGTKVSDVRYASQSEIALMTMALSFALATKASGEYNILLLDEIDAGLDETNRNAFLKMLYMIMNMLHVEQLFLISHNLTQMINIPMDCIRLGYSGIRSKLQNVIYDIMK